MNSVVRQFEYADMLTDPRWQRKRLEIMQRDGWKCRKCGDGLRTLHVHHVQYRGATPWDCPDEDMLTLCEACHEYAHYSTQPEVVAAVADDEPWRVLPDGTLVFSEDWLSPGYAEWVGAHVQVLLVCNEDGTFAAFAESADGGPDEDKTSGPCLFRQAVEWAASYMANSVLAVTASVGTKPMSRAGTGAAGRERGVG